MKISDVTFPAYRRKWAGEIHVRDIEGEPVFYNGKDPTRGLWLDIEDLQADDWEHYADNDFQWALKQLENGKVVRRRAWPEPINLYATHDGLLWSNGMGYIAHLDDLTAKDWCI